LDECRILFNFLVRHQLAVLVLQEMALFMTTKTILQFQFGNAVAIRRVAESKSALWVGMILVLLTAIARSYDQTFILEKPLFWLFGPLLFSIGSATFVFCFIYLVFIRPHISKPKPGFASEYLSFIGLFWMTAPIAWLYALPVERFLGTYQAAQANLTLLGIVALWRVLLLARVFSVVQQTAFWRTFLWVLIPASIEVILLYIFGGAFAKAIAAGMGGMRNSPEEELLLDAMSFSANNAFWIVIIAIVLAVIFRKHQPLQSFPARTSGRFPAFGLAVLASFWVAVAIYPQIQVSRNYHVEQLMEAEKYKEALQFLSKHQEDDFASARQLPPKPFEYELFEKLPKIFETMDGTEEPWVRKMYLERLDVLLTHSDGWRESFTPIYVALARIPEGADWVQKNFSNINEFARLRSENDQVKSGRVEFRTLQSTLEALGFQTNSLPQ
jgi:hypothetical protein